MVNLTQQAVADGANLIQQQGDVGLDKTTKLPLWQQGDPQFLLLDVRRRRERRALRPSRGPTIARTTWCPRKRDRDEFLKVLDWDS